MDKEMSLEDAIDVLKALFQARFPEVDLAAARFQLQLQCFQNSFMLPVAALVPYALSTFRNAVTAAQGHVKDLFHAGDLTDEGFLSYFQFDLMCRHLAPASYEATVVKRLYETAADLVVQPEEGKEEQLAISFKKFSVLSIEYDLFSVQTQNRFLSASDIHSSLLTLRTNTDHIGSQLLWRLRSTPQLLGGQQASDWIERFCWALGSDLQERAVLLAYRLIDAETRRLVCEYWLCRAVTREMEPDLCRFVEEAVCIVESVCVNS
jgi:hypothetical protein